MQSVNLSYVNRCPTIIMFWSSAMDVTTSQSCIVMHSVWKLILNNLIHKFLGICFLQSLKEFWQRTPYLFFRHSFLPSPDIASKIIKDSITGENRVNLPQDDSDSDFDVDWSIKTH